MGTLPAVLTAAAGLVAAVTALIAQWRHAHKPAQRAHPPSSSGGAAGTTPPVGGYKD